MQIVSPQDTLEQALRGAVVAIGNFDGLHRGHRALLAHARELAHTVGKPLGLLTFEPHPRSFFRPDDPVFRLTPLALKQRIAQTLGLDYFSWQDFDSAFSAMSAEDFMHDILKQRFGVSHVVTGYDFHFGKGRKGNADLLRDAGPALGFSSSAIDQVTDDDGQAPFSSSSIRTALRRGHVKAAARELGYEWTVLGEVVHGDKRGRTIGFPTANIILEKGAEPFRGIYAVRVQDAHASNAKPWMGAAYFGDRPTFNTNRTFLEVYLLDQDLDLYGRTLLVSFVDLVRPDKTFRSVGELVTQMNLDCAEVRQILNADG